MRAQRIIGVMITSVALAMTGMVGATTAQANDLGQKPAHHREYHHKHHHKHHHKRHHRKHHHRREDHRKHHHHKESHHKG
jgi:Ni/Co efflux regulator RcnB